MHQRRTMPPGSIVERRRSSRVVLRRNKIKTNTNFEFSIHRLFLPLIVSFSILWIRMLWIIGSRRSLSISSSSNATIPITATATNIKRQMLRIEGGEEEGQQKHQQPQPKFQLLSNDAPNCHTLSSSDEIDLTVVTQLSHDRLWMMEHHCKRYGPHRISIAVYTNQSHQEVITELINMGCRIAFTTTTTDTTNATAALLSVIVMNATKAHNKNKNNDYPVNELRNLALRAVRTTHIMYIDVDFWTSKNLYESILGHQPIDTNTNSIIKTIRQKLYMDPKLALVIPAFQLRRTPNCLDEKKDCRSEHVPLMPFTNSELMKLLLSLPPKKGADIFDPTNSGGHGSTDYNHWLSQQQRQQSKLGNETTTIGTGTLLLHPIDCLKSHRYEPYVVIRYCREITPPFQSIFSGYGKNKMTWMMQIVRSGFVFSQVQDAYLVHYPHPISASRINWNQSPKQLQQQHNQQNYNVRRPKKSDTNLHFDHYKRGQIDQLYVEFKSWLELTIPSSQTRIPMCTTTNNNNDGNGIGIGIGAQVQVQDDDNKLWIDPNRKKWK